MDTRGAHRGGEAPGGTSGSASPRPADAAAPARNQMKPLSGPLTADEPRDAGPRQVNSGWRAVPRAHFRLRPGRSAWRAGRAERWRVSAAAAAGAALLPLAPGPCLAFTQQILAGSLLSAEHWRCNTEQTVCYKSAAWRGGGGGLRKITKEVNVC